MIDNQHLPENISYYQIVRVYLDPIQLWLRLDLIDPIELKKVAIDLRNMVYFSLSKTLSDEDGCYLLGEIKLSFISVEDREMLLSKLGYGFTVHPDIKTIYNMYHLHIEGDICLDVVCEYYKQT